MAFRGRVGMFMGIGIFGFMGGDQGQQEEGQENKG